MNYNGWCAYNLHHIFCFWHSLLPYNLNSPFNIKHAPWNTLCCTPSIIICVFKVKETTILVTVLTGGLGTRWYFCSSVKHVRIPVRVEKPTDKVCLTFLSVSLSVPLSHLSGSSLGDLLHICSPFIKRACLISAYVSIFSFYISKHHTVYFTVGHSLN